MKDKINSTYILILIGVLAFAALAFLYSNKDTALTIDIYHDQSLVSSKSLDISRSLTQSVIDIGTTENPYAIVASKTIDPADTAVMKIRLPNQNNFPITVTSIDIQRNGAPVLYKDFNAEVLPGQSFDYTSSKIELAGNPGVNNMITADVTYRQDGTFKVVRYEYKYLLLITCDSDVTCPLLTPYCDVSDRAGYSYEGNHYCVKICLTNANCPEGQICLPSRVCKYQTR